jgi:DNA-binding MarR family transcriptional regulator
MTPKTELQAQNQKKKSSITAKEADFLRLITRMIKRDSMSPTLAELAEAQGFTKATAAYYVRRLRASGHLVNAKGKFRAIRPTVSPIQN